MKVSSSIVTFRIDIDFPDCEVDMVYKEMASRGVTTPVPSMLCGSAQIPIDKSKLKNTPTEFSVDWCLNWLAGYVDRNEMCIENGKQDFDRSKGMITVTREDGFKYSTYPEFKTELEEIGIDVESWYGLMMGTCHLICTCEMDVFSKDLVDSAKNIVEDIFKRFIQFHQTAKAS